MANVNVDFVTKVVEIEVNDNQPESLAALAAVNAAARADQAADIVVDNIDATLAALEDKGNTEIAAIGEYAAAQEAELNEQGQQYVNEASTILAAVKNEYGYPFTAATAAAMTDPKKIYVYTGSEVGYTAGNWYYHNGTAFVSGGVYNSTAFDTDDTLAVSDMAADAKATGDTIKATKSEMSLMGVDDILWENTFYDGTSSSVGGVDYTVDRINKTITASGTTLATSYFRFYYSTSTFPLWLIKGKTYYAHFVTNTNMVFQIGWYNSNETYTKVAECDKDTPYAEFVVPDSAVGLSVRIADYTVSDAISETYRPYISEANSLQELTEIAKTVEPATVNKNVFELYTEFTFESGWWNSTGGLVSMAQSHTNLVSVRPNTQYYMGYKVTGNSVYGAFFDKKGKWIAPLLNADLTQYTYQIPNADPDSTLTSYAAMYTFTTPAGAAYFSYNKSNNANNSYRLYICSKPIFMLSNTGDYVFTSEDALYQRWRNKKLCVIGSSNTMIDRLSRTVDGASRYIVGFQEYLYPFFAAVDSYGYSSASWAKYDVEDGASVRSIYSRIVTDQLDLSGYDVFLLMQSGNHLSSSTIGSVTSPSDLGDEETYVGAMRQVIDYIYTSNPQALVFVQLIRYRGDYELGYAANEEIKKMANYISCPVIDLWSDAGMNAYNHELYSYDGGNHLNQIGNNVMGMAIRKAIIGF